MIRPLTPGAAFTPEQEARIAEIVGMTLRYIERARTEATADEIDCIVSHFAEALGKRRG